MKLHYNIILLFILIIPAILYAKKEPQYPVSEIPEELLKNADAVVREKSMTLDITSPDRVTSQEKYVITILKQSGFDKAEFKEYYSKLVDISNINATLYDSKGDKIEKIKQEDILDFSAISGYSLYEDNRVKVIYPHQKEFPFTIEYTFERKMNSAFFIHDWYVFDGYNTSVQNAKLTIKIPEDFELNYKEQNLNSKVNITKENGIKEYSWVEKNYIAPDYESLSNPVRKWAPMVSLAASKFEFQNYKGSFDTWKDFGSFIYQLNEGRDTLPAEIFTKIDSLITPEMTDYEKIATIYQFAQDKNRYVNISVGIGGWQPFPAETVDRLSYGDCKALSNYTVTLLKHYGYDAKYNIVRAGNQNYFDPTFVNNYFNHAVACVVLKNDTIWLECTNSFVPAGYFGDFTDDRYILMINPEGGELVKTPSYSIKENNQGIKGTIKLFNDGSAVAEYTTTYKGATYSDQFGLTLLDETDRRKRVIKSIHIPHFELVDYKLALNKCRTPTMNKKVKLVIPQCATPMGGRFFLQLNTVNELSNIPSYSRNRKSPLFIQRNYSEDDTITYELPEGFSLEAIPDPVSIESEYGTYSFNVENKGDSIIFTRHFEIRKGEFPKEQYNDFVEFLEKIVQSDKSKAVISKKS